MKSIVKNDIMVGASVHSLEESIEAEAAGADWLTFGPVYDTPSKRAYGAPQGLAALERVAKAVRIPVVAIGGIGPARLPVRRAGRDARSQGGRSSRRGRHLGHPRRRRSLRSCPALSRCPRADRGRVRPLSIARPRP